MTRQTSFKVKLINSKSPNKLTIIRAKSKERVLEVPVAIYSKSAYQMIADANRRISARNLELQTQ